MQSIFPFLLLLFSFTVTAQNYPDLVAYYSFDNCDLTDEAGFGGDGTIFGDPECVDGISGNALYFSGDDYAHFYGDVNSFFGTEDFTISFWLNIVSGSRQNILGKREYCNATNMLEFNYSGKYSNVPVNLDRIGVQLRESNQNGNVFTENYDTLCWKMITFTRFGKTSKVYLNDELIDSQTTSEVVYVADNTPLYISDSPCHTHPGDNIPRLQSTIDELRIYSKALSEIEVANLFNSYSEEYTEACEDDEPVGSGGFFTTGYPTTISNTITYGGIKQVTIKGGGRPIKTTEVFNSNGERVLLRSNVDINLKNYFNNGFNSGMYFYKITTTDTNDSINVEKGKFIIH